MPKDFAGPAEKGERGKKNPKSQTHSYELRKPALGINETIQVEFYHGILKSHFSEWKLVHLFET